MIPNSEPLSPVDRQMKIRSGGTFTPNPSRQVTDLENLQDACEHIKALEREPGTLSSPIFVRLWKAHGSPLTGKF